MKFAKTIFLAILLTFTFTAAFASNDMPDDSRRRGGRNCDARYCEDDRRDTDEPSYDDERDNRGGPDDDSDPDFGDREDEDSDLFSRSYLSVWQIEHIFDALSAERHENEPVR